MNIDASRLKRIYWAIEAYIYQSVAIIRPVIVGKKKHNLPKKLIVSLTSFPPRFKKLPLTIKCLLTQSLKADIIILWIARGDEKFLTDEIFDLEKKHSHFIIEYCEDIKSYKKIIPSLKKYPDSYIVTADDDVFYPWNWLENLTKDFKTNKEIITYRAHQITFDNGKMKSYKDWKHCVNDSGKNSFLFQTGIGGVLYPPNSLHPEVNNIDSFIKNCPTADDIWLYCMAKMQGSKIVKTTRNYNIVNWPGTDKDGLAIKNVISDGNDESIKKLEEQYSLCDHI